jgi:hypothetical protein
LVVESNLVCNLIPSPPSPVFFFFLRWQLLLLLLLRGLFLQLNSL